MQINSVWHLTHSSRSLRINKSGSGKNAAIVFTQPGEKDAVIESTRIALPNTAKRLRFRKYLILGEDSTISVGPFNISTREVDESGEKCNILINDEFYYLTFIPENFYAVPDGVTLLLPAEAEITEKEIKKLITLSKQTDIRKGVVSGKFAEKWRQKLKGSIICEVIDNVSQQGLF